MYYAQLTGGIVTSVTETHSALPDSPDHILVDSLDASLLGHRYANGTFTPPPPPAPQKVTSVTMRQARLALLEAGKLSMVQPAINTLPEPSKSRAQIEWDYSNEVHRDESFVATLGGALGLDNAALDALFEHAATL